MRPPGLEPGTPAWKADMLTLTPQTLYSMVMKRYTLYLFILNEGPDGVLIPSEYCNPREFAHLLVVSQQK